MEQDPTELEALVTLWLDDPALEDRLVELYGQSWHTLTDDKPLDALEYRLDPEVDWRLKRAMGEEPLRLLAHVVVADRDYREIVTSDTTMANELLGQVWPLDYPEDGEGWQEVTWTDGRPAAGVLASNGLWFRYSTTNFNFNRGRAAAISRLLVCSDVLNRPVVGFTSPSLFDEDGTAEAVKNQPACVTCHSSLDPLASALFGFWWYDIYDVQELTSYHPERELLGETYLDRSPAWYGQPVAGLEELGRAVAADPRFDRCAVETLAGGLWRREVGLGDLARLSALEDAFVAADRRGKALLGAIVATPEYQAGEQVEGSARDEQTLRLLHPDQLASALEDVTGFRWTDQDVDLLLEDEAGYRVLLGGVDGRYVTRPSDRASLTWGLASKRLAEAAAEHALSTGRLRIEGAPGEADFRNDLSRLHWRLLARRASEGELDGLVQLGLDVQASADTETARWACLVALLRHPEFLSL